jgi:hypothetical protein
MRQQHGWIYGMVALLGNYLDYVVRQICGGGEGGGSGRKGAMTGELRGDRMKKIKIKNWKNVEEPSKETEVIDPTIFFCLMEKLLDR